MTAPTSQLFGQTATVTVGNTTDETSLIGAGVGSATLPANALAPGKSVRVRAAGYYSTSGSPTLAVNLKLGGTTISAMPANNAPPNVTTLGWLLDCFITCRTDGASGTVIAQGFVLKASAHTTADADDFTPATTTTTVDTTGPLALALTVQWGTANASNTISCTNLSISMW